MSKKAQKALFSIKARTAKLGNLPIKISCNLFDSLVKPVLTYNSEVSFMDTYHTLYKAKIRLKSQSKNLDHFIYLDKSPFEKIHNKFCKFTLGTKKCSSNIGVRAELGRLPIENFIKCQALLYLARLNNENINPFLKETYTLSENLDKQDIYSWFSFIKDILSEININIKEIVDCKTNKDVKNIKPKIKKALNDFYLQLFQNKINNFDSHNKLYLYKNIKVTLEQEYYLQHPNFEIRRIFTTLRISDHNLQIEKGRYINCPREQRLCQYCSVIEDEQHFLLHCKNNQNLRNNLFSDISIENDDFTSFTDNEKLVVLLNPTNLAQVKRTGSFIKQSLELRTGDS